MRSRKGILSRLKSLTRYSVKSDSSFYEESSEPKQENPIPPSNIQETQRNPQSLQQPPSIPLIPLERTSPHQDMVGGTFSNDPSLQQQNISRSVPPSQQLSEEEAQILLSAGILESYNQQLTQTEIGTLKEILYGPPEEERKPKELAPNELVAVRNLFGPESSRKTLFDIVGAPNGSDIDLTVGPQGRLKVHLYNPMIENCTRLFGIDANGDLWCYNSELILRPQFHGKGNGLDIFSNQVTNFGKVGGKRIECMAMRSPVHNGHYTWALFGYDQGIDEFTDEEFKKKLRRRFPNAKSVQDIFKVRSLTNLPSWEAVEIKLYLQAIAKKLGRTPKPLTNIAGPDWWRVYGQTMQHAVFSLEKGSTSMLVHEKLLANKRK